MQKKKPLFSDIIKPERLLIKKDPHHEIMEKKYSGAMEGDKKLHHKRDRRDYRRIIEESIEDEE